MEVRRQVFAACAERGIPAVTVAPLGMGVALLNFLPGKMTFEEYFRLEGQPRRNNSCAFFWGSPPRCSSNATDRSFYDQPGGTSRSLHQPGLRTLCRGSGRAGFEILLRRDHLTTPRGLHFDAYCNQVARTWLPWGNDNPLQRLKLSIARRRFAKAKNRTPARPEPISQGSVVRQILELARWAPSGDNTQPWRFEIEDEQHLVVHGFDMRDHVIYDLQGRASQLALGGLLETIEIAARSRGLKCDINRRQDMPEI